MENNFFIVLLSCFAYILMPHNMIIYFMSQIMVYFFIYCTLVLSCYINVDLTISVSTLHLKIIIVYIVWKHRTREMLVRYIMLNICACVSNMSSILAIIFGAIVVVVCYHLIHFGFDEVSATRPSFRILMCSRCSIGEFQALQLIFLVVFAVVDQSLVSCM